MTDTNRQWVLKNRPVGAVKDTDFELRTGPVPEPGPGEFLIRVTHLAFGPTQRIWISADSYVPAVPIGAVVRAIGVGQVVRSRHPDFAAGELVQGALGWQDYLVSNGVTDILPVTKLAAGMSAEQALGVFGITGLTAYFGFTDLGKPKSGDIVVVSGAAGATGSIVVQLAKAFGCNVIGIAGGPEKCRWLLDQARADAAIDYKRENIGARIKELAPNGVNVVFENVGGAVLDASLQNLARHARVVLCGAISGYDAVDPGSTVGIRNYMMLTIMRAHMQGFIVTDYAPRFGEAAKALSELVAEGKLKTQVDLQHGFENIPATLRRLFGGKNIGKQLLKLADPPRGGTQVGQRLS